MLRPAIVTPTYQGPVPFYVDCVTSLVAGWTGKHRFQPPFRMVKGGDPAFQCWSAVRKMKEQNLHTVTDGVLFIEHDHAFMLDDAERLLQLAATVPEAVVGGLYYQRMTDRLVGEFDLYREDPPHHDLQPCSSVGLGFCWVPWGVFQKVPEPWFDPRWSSVGDGTWTRDSHDTAFCRDAVAAGVRLYGVVLPNLLHQHDVDPRGVRVKS